MKNSNTDIEVYNDFMNTIEQSWTWERLTDNDKTRFKYTLLCILKLKSENNVLNMLYQIYGLFIEGIKY